MTCSPAKRPRHSLLTAVSFSLLASLTLGAPAAADLDIVFVLDTTGSMQRELDEAKERIVDLAQSIRAARPGQTVRFGVVAYRDRGDDYVTRMQDLSQDVGRPLAVLRQLQAHGGGDGPEDVLAGVATGIRDMAWSPDAERMLFLIGDAPPHLDYGDSPRPEDLVDEALRERVAIHAIGCRSLPAAGSDFFRRLAYSTEGSYQHIGAVRAAEPQLTDALLRAAAPVAPAAAGEPVPITPLAHREGGAGTALLVRHGGRSGSSQGGGQALDACTLEVRVPPGMRLADPPAVGLGDVLDVELSVAADPASNGTVDLFTLERCPALSTPVRVAVTEA